jgi:hypothetical protein
MVSTSSKCKIGKLAVWLADGLTYIIFHLLCMSAWTRNIKSNHDLFALTQTGQTLYPDTQNKKICHDLFTPAHILVSTAHVHLPQEWSVCNNMIL